MVLHRGEGLGARVWFRGIGVSFLVFCIVRFVFWLGLRVWRFGSYPGCNWLLY